MIARLSHGLTTTATGFGVGILLGNGDGTFQPVVYFCAGGWLGIEGNAFSVSISDLNGDNMPDIIAMRNFGMGILMNVSANGNNGDDDDDDDDDEDDSTCFIKSLES